MISVDYSVIPEEDKAKIEAYTIDSFFKELDEHMGSELIENGISELSEKYDYVAIRHIMHNLIQRGSNVQSIFDRLIKLCIVNNRYYCDFIPWLEVIFEFLIDNGANIDHAVEIIARREDPEDTDEQNQNVYIGAKGLLIDAVNGLYSNNIGMRVSEKILEIYNINIEDLQTQDDYDEVNIYSDEEYFIQLKSNSEVLKTL